MWFQLSAGVDPGAVATAVPMPAGRWVTAAARLAVGVAAGVAAYLVVELLSVPLLLVAVWRRPAEAMLRAIIYWPSWARWPRMCSAGTPPPAKVLRLLGSQIPAPQPLGHDPRQWVRLAGEPRPIALKVKVAVHPGPNGHFAA